MVAYRCLVSTSSTDVRGAAAFRRTASGLDYPLASLAARPPGGRPLPSVVEERAPASVSKPLAWSAWFRQAQPTCGCGCLSAYGEWSRLSTRFARCSTTCVVDRCSPRWLRSERQRASRNHWIQPFRQPLVGVGSAAVAWPRQAQPTWGCGCSFGVRRVVSTIHSLRSLLDHLWRRPLLTSVVEERAPASVSKPLDQLMVGTRVLWFRQAQPTLGVRLPFGLRRVVSTIHSLRSLLDHLRVRPVVWWLRASSNRRLARLRLPGFGKLNRRGCAAFDVSASLDSTRSARCSTTFYRNAAGDPGVGNQRQTTADWPSVQAALQTQ